MKKKSNRKNVKRAARPVRAEFSFSDVRKIIKEQQTEIMNSLARALGSL